MTVIARQLNWPIGIVYSRLAHARELLRARLIRRGLAPAVTIGALELGQQMMHAGVPPTLTAATARLAGLVASSELGATVGASAAVTALVDGMLKMMVLSKLKLAAVVFLATGLIMAGAGGLAHQTLARKVADRTTNDEKPALILSEQKAVWIIYSNNQSA